MAIAEHERIAPAAAAAAVGIAAALPSIAAHGGVGVGSVAQVLAAVAVYFWAEDVYGMRAAAAATLLFSFNPLVAGLAPQNLAAVCLLLFAAAAHRAQRCLLDPSLGDSFVVGALVGVALLTTEAAAGLVPYAAIAVLLRVATSSDRERRGRTLRASASALFIAGAVAVSIYGLGIPWAPPASALLSSHPPGGTWAVLAAAAPLVLAVTRPWRAHRRFADGNAAAAAVCLGVAAWWSDAALAAARAALPAVVVLAAAAWDHRSSAVRRRVAWTLVAAQTVAFLTAAFTG